MAFIWQLGGTKQEEKWHAVNSNLSRVWLSVNF